jgi:hypothetical protein
VHLHLPHLPLPLVLLSALYGMAIAVAVANPGRPTFGGLVVLAGLSARWMAHHRHRVLHRATVGAADAEPVVAPAVAT